MTVLEATSFIQVVQLVATATSRRLVAASVASALGGRIEVCPMPESFGARLRQQREARQIHLLAISEQTKIKLALL